MTSPTTRIQERRRRERFETDGLEATCGGCRLEVQNLSLSGLSFATESRLTPGSSVQLKMSSDSGEMKVAGRVVWCRMTGSVTAPDGAVHPRYRGGVHFDEIGEPDGAMLVELVAQLWEKKS